MSEIDNLRSKYSVPLSPMMRPQCMDQSEPFDCPPVQPSIRTDHLEPQNSIELTLRQLDLALGVIYQLGREREERGIGTFPIYLDSFRTECGPRSTVERLANQIKISPRPNTMGS